MNTKKSKMVEHAKSNKEEEDDIISQAIGNFGRYQFLFTFLLSLSNFANTWHIFVTIVQGDETGLYCAVPKQFTGMSPALWINQSNMSEDSCLVLDWRKATLKNGVLNGLGKTYIACEEWQFHDKHSSLKTKFRLLCGRKTYYSIAEMCFLGGVALGGLICGIFSDKFGRRRMMMISVFSQASIGTAIAFAPYFELFCFLRFCLGFVSVSVVFCGFVLCMELVGGCWRAVIGISYLFPASMGYITMAGLGYFIRDFQTLELTISLPGFLYLTLFLIFPESPRWLLAMGRTDSVMKILKRASKFNKKPLPENIDKLLIADDEDVQSKAGILDLFKTKDLRRKTFLLAIIWFTVYLLYYGLLLNLDSLGGSLYLNAILMGTVEFPALIVSILILLKGARRWTLALSMIFTGVLCGFVMPVQQFANDLRWMKILLFMSAKLCISSSNVVMPVFTAELYPTTVRNVGVGVSNVPAGIALLLVPYYAMLSDVHICLPMFVLAFFGIFGGICVLFLPETSHVSLTADVRRPSQVLTDSRDSSCNCS